MLKKTYHIFCILLTSICTYGDTYSLEYALNGHQVHNLQSQSYDLVVGSEYPAYYGLSEEIQVEESRMTENLSMEHTFLDLWTDYLSGESATILFQGAPLREPLNQWKHAKWFGYYIASDYPWVYNFPLGWLYVQESIEEGVWLWHGQFDGREKLGWIWTNAESFPYFYLPSIDRWTFYNNAENLALFYDYHKSEWFDSNVPYNISFSANIIGAGNVDGVGDFYRWQKTQIHVLPDQGYNFAGWSGDYYRFPESFEIEVLKNEVIHANFVPRVSHVSAVSEVMIYAVEVIQSMEGLSEVEKERSIAELLKYGTSTTAGFSVLDK